MNAQKDGRVRLVKRMRMTVYTIDVKMAHPVLTESMNTSVNVVLVIRVCVSKCITLVIFECMNNRCKLHVEEIKIPKAVGRLLVTS